jgi:hypothetical protein
MGDVNSLRWPIVESVYGPLARDVWTGHPPSPFELSEWLRTQRVGWSVRSWPVTDKRVTTVTNWARQQCLKRLDWDCEPMEYVWFREPEIAMLWDLCGPK